MKKLILLLLIVPLLFAKTANQESIKEALGELEDTTTTFMAVTTFLTLGIGIVLLILGGVVYFLKLKGKEKKETLWLAVAGILAVFGVIILLMGILSLITYLATPVMVDSMMGH